MAGLPSSLQSSRNAACERLGVPYTAELVPWPSALRCFSHGLSENTHVNDELVLYFW